MFDKKLIKILERLQPFGYEDKQEISDLLNILFPIPQNITENEFNISRNYLIRFLTTINHIDSPYEAQQKGGDIKFDIILEILMNVTTPFRRKLTTHSGRN